MGNELTVTQKKDLEERIKWLYDLRFIEDVSEEEEDLWDNKAEEVVKLYGWEETLKSFTSFIHTNTKTPKDAINYATLFWNCSWYENFIPNPYDFFAFFWDKINFNIDRYDPVDILWSLMRENMSRYGYKKLNSWINPDYFPIEDKELVRAVFRLRNEDNIDDCIIPAICVGDYELHSSIKDIESILNKKNIKYEKSEANTIKTDDGTLSFKFIDGKLRLIHMENNFPGIEREGIRIGMDINKAVSLKSSLKYDETKDCWNYSDKFYVYIDKDTNKIIAMDCSRA